MPRKLTDTQLLNRSIRKLKKLFEPNCHDNSRDTLLYGFDNTLSLKECEAVISYFQNQWTKEVYTAWLER